MNILDNLVDIKIKNDMGIYGFTDEFFCVYLYNLFNKTNKSLLVVCDSINEANNIYSSLSNYLDDICLYPMDDFLMSEAIAISPDLLMSRLETINHLVNNEKKIVICNLTAYLRFLPNVDTYNNLILKLRVGEEYDFNKLKEQLFLLGYKQDSIVDKTGESAVRGFIIDVFPVFDEHPVRIEFFGDEIESIRYFSETSQRSLEEIDSVTIYPCTDFLSLNSIDDDKLFKQKYLPEIENVNSIGDYIDGIVVYKDYNLLKSSYEEIKRQIYDYNLEKDKDFKGKYIFELNKMKHDNVLYCYFLNNYVHNKKDIIKYDVKSIGLFHESILLINSFIGEKFNEGKTVIMCLKSYQARSISKNINFKYIFTDFDNIKEGYVNFVNFDMNQGFEYNNYVFITKKELFNEKPIKHKYRNKFKYTKAIRDINKIDIGDYVVHDLYGIGKYNGIKVLESNGISKDYIEIIYAGKDKVYIPVEKISSLFKYSGREGNVPKLNSLSGTDWIKTKKRVLNKINDMTDRLIKLYSERSARRGYAFSEDSDLNVEFEKDIDFELTEDQKKVIFEIKKDMESPQPMDRLLCGDVGFGKTEVAFVVAFKAIMDSKQVLFLCPTTILSNQHYENALARFKNFPVNICLLNRFSSPKDIRKVVDGLRNGSIDMVIGTHRLLSSDVKPSNLGLLIIDEEQRFGVTHKERIKEFKTNVDVLTLSATPIPRTLQMSLTGIRSLSLVETPPVNRYPVQTYVIEESEQIIKDAINKEVSRGGQCFVLYNRVESIEWEMEKLQKLLPNIKFGIAHGRLKKKELENVLNDFLNNKFEVLVCSTIIETGIDMPNVNTLIIIDADRFGLAQLYQLRGRVGRSNRFAYAYLMYKPFKKLTSNATKRLNVIKEFTELGSGFSIASYDLSIRGAGDILGSEQAGFIDSVGADLYLKMLDEEVKKKTGTYYEEEDTNTKPLLNVGTHISDLLGTEDEVKIEIHKLINTIDSYKSLENIRSEIEDRFGSVDENLEIYMYEEWFEKICLKLKITKVNETRNFIEVIIPGEIINSINMEDLFVKSIDISNRFRFISRGTNLVISLNTIRIDKHPVYLLVELLDYILKMID